MHYLAVPLLCKLYGLYGIMANGFDRYVVPKKLKLLPVNYCSCKILPLGRITSCHHIFCVKNLSCQFVDAQISIYFTASGTQRSNARSEEMQSRKRNQVGSKFSQI